MANIENIYTGDGTSVLFPFTFEYINAEDVRVQLDGVDTTEYSLANATTVEMDAAPANGVLIRIYRKTATDSMPATFFSGSTIQANDLNDNFNVALFVSQEAQESAASAADALPVAIEARATANAAKLVADTAAADAQTANDAALEATTDATEAKDQAASAEATAISAEATANAAAALVASANLPEVVANVAAIPASPDNNDLVEVTDSTGIESFTPLQGLPPGFTGEAQLAVKILYQVNTWTYVEYRPTDPDSRYQTEPQVDAKIDVVEGEIATVGAVAASALNTANGALQRSGGTMTGQIIFAPGQSFGIGVGNASTAGILKLSSATNSTDGTGQGTAATPSSVKSAYDRATTAINTANNASNKAEDAENVAVAAAQSAATKLPLTGGTLTGNLTVPAGTSGTRLTFGTPDSGLGFRAQNNAIEARSGGNTVMTMADGLTTVQRINITAGGSGTNPTIRFNDTDTGLYYSPSVGSGALRLTKNGDVQWTFSANKLSFNTGEGDIDSYDGDGDGENSQGFRLRGRGRGNDDYSWFAANTESSSARVLVVGGDGNSNKRMIIYADGTADLDGSAITSDINLKQNIKDARPQWDDIKALRFRNFEYIGSPGEERFGWIAQEVQQVSPGAVVNRGDHLSVRADLLTWKGLKALQEAMERIEQLEARINELESK